MNSIRLTRKKQHIRKGRNAINRHRSRTFQFEGLEIRAMLDGSGLVDAAPNLAPENGAEVPGEVGENTTGGEVSNPAELNQTARDAIFAELGSTKKDDLIIHFDGLDNVRGEPADPTPEDDDPTDAPYDEAGSLEEENQPQEFGKEAAKWIEKLFEPDDQGKPDDTGKPDGQSLGGLLGDDLYDGNGNCDGGCGCDTPDLNDLIRGIPQGPATDVKAPPLDPSDLDPAKSGECNEDGSGKPVHDISDFGEIGDGDCVL